MKNLIAEQAGQQRGDDNAQGGQQHRFYRYGARSLPFRSKSAVEHDKN